MRAATLGFRRRVVVKQALFQRLARARPIRRSPSAGLVPQSEDESGWSSTGGCPGLPPVGTDATPSDSCRGRKVEERERLNGRPRKGSPPANGLFHGVRTSCPCRLPPSVKPVHGPGRRRDCAPGGRPPSLPADRHLLPAGCRCLSFRTPRRADKPSVMDAPCDVAPGKAPRLPWMRSKQRRQWAARKPSPFPLLAFRAWSPCCSRMLESRRIDASGSLLVDSRSWCLESSTIPAPRLGVSAMFLPPFRCFHFHRDPLCAPGGGFCS